MTDIALSSNGIVLTERAARRIAQIMAKKPETKALRVAVLGGGCSGFQYDYQLVSDTPEDDDLVIEKHGATVYIDSLSQEFLGGAHIDFADDLIGQAFKIENPNTVASCGCGNSFSVA